jgi:uncharacterized membrane protein
MALSNPLALLFLLTLPYFIWLGRPAGLWGRSRAAVAMILRVLIIVLLTLALAGLQVVTVADRLAVVFLIDGSDSMPPEAIESARKFAADSISQMRPDDQAAIIVFGTDALVERPMTGSKNVGPIESKVLPLNTNLAEAIRLGMALFPPGAARRMVILSDGLANLGDAESAARLAAASDVQIMAVPYSAVHGAEVLVTGVDVPTRLNENQTFDLTVTVESSIQTDATLRVLGAGQVLVEQPVHLAEGVNRYTFTLTAQDAGLTTFRAQIIPAGGDVFYQNNELSAFTQVVGPPRILMVADDETEMTHLAAALLAQGLIVDRVESGGLPTDLATLSNYQSIVLVDIPARNLGRGRMQALQTYVRDLGGGLVAVGGPNSFAVGGYFQTPLEEMLPVEMQLKDQERLPRLTVAYVIDKSGSMSDTSVGGFQKVELAKEAIIRSVAMLSPLDRVGVIAFDESAKWVVDMTPASDKNEIARRVATIRADGGTDIYAGVLAISKVMPNEPGDLRHIVLLTDGGADETGIPDLVKKMYEDDGITFSVIAIGQGYAPFIEELPKLADGRFHFAYNVDTIPEIFSEETVLATRAYIIEHEFYPALTSSSPIMTGISSTPSILGYIGSTIKPTARQILATDQKDPLLAAWQYGLGRTVAWTSDATGRWAANWVSWPDYARFWSQAVRWTITEGASQNVEVRVTQQGDTAHIVVDAHTDTGGYLNGLNMAANVINPDLSSTPLELAQTAPGRYEGAFKPDQEGAYFVRVAGNDPSAPGSDVAAVAQTAGWVLSYSPEYRSFEGNPQYLEFIAGLAGGGLAENPASVIAHNLPVRQTPQPIWPWLVLAAVLLLPFDIAVRRLIMTRSDWEKIAARLGIRQASRQIQSGASRVGTLLSVKERTASTRGPRPVMAPPDPSDRTQVSESTGKIERRIPQPGSGRGTASSLLKSKRARRGEESEE